MTGPGTGRAGGGPGVKMLSQDDRRRLDAIERQLNASDPDLVHLLTHWPTPARARCATAAAGATIVAGTPGFLIGVLALKPTLVVCSVLRP